MTRSMLDAAGLHDPIRHADVWAGYLRSPHSSGGGWPLSYWPRVKAVSDALLPIYVIGPAYNAPAVAASIDFQLRALGAPRGIAVCIDIEHYDARSAFESGVWPKLQHELTSRGYVPVVYCSRTDSGLFPGHQWLGDWTGHEHRSLDSDITQWAAPGFGAPAGYDLSTVYASLPLWPTRDPHDPTTPGDPTMAGWLTMVAKPSSVAADQGVWWVDVEGHVFAFGDAKFYGGQGSWLKDRIPVPAHTPGARQVVLNGRCIGLAPTPSGHGYWLGTSEGSAYAFGDAETLPDPKP